MYFALGGRSNPDYYARMADRLATIFPDFTIETFPERHHFDPPHRIEPEHLADSLLALWQRATHKQLDQRSGSTSQRSSTRARTRSSEPPTIRTQSAVQPGHGHRA